MAIHSSFTDQHLEQLEFIYKKLAELPNSESCFTQMESLFYDTLAIAHYYGDTEFLLQLKILQSDHYQRAQKKTLTFKMRVSAIRRFKNILRQQINSVLKQFPDAAT